MGDRLQTTIEALETLLQWRRLPEVRMLADPPGLDRELEAICASHPLRGGAWTDAYLAAFAISGNLRSSPSTGDSGDTKG